MTASAIGKIKGNSVENRIRGDVPTTPDGQAASERVMANPIQARFPLNASGYVVVVAASHAVAPYTYVDGLKFDATGALVVAG